ERAQRQRLPRREATVAQNLRICCEQLSGRRHVTSELLLQAPDDRAGRGDRQLLSRDLEDQRAERVEQGQLVEPGPGTEVRPGIDQPREDGVRIAQEL